MMTTETFKLPPIISTMIDRNGSLQVQPSWLDSNDFLDHFNIKSQIVYNECFFAESTQLSTEYREIKKNLLTDFTAIYNCIKTQVHANFWNAAKIKINQEVIKHIEENEKNCRKQIQSILSLVVFPEIPKILDSRNINMSTFRQCYGKHKKNLIRLNFLQRENLFKSY